MKHALVIVDHGSRRPEAHQHLEWIADQVRERKPGLGVYIAHMELAEPSLKQAIESCARDGQDEVVVHPLFLVPGRHLSEDIPELVRSASEAHPRLKIRVSDPVGSHPSIADLILQTLP